jgi:hypothetical protein
VGLVFRIVRYLVGAALVLAGAGYLALSLAVPLAPGTLASGSRLALLRTALEHADPKHLAVGAAAALAGLLIARAPFSMAPAKGRARERKRLPPGKAVDDLRSADPEVRLEAATDLLSAARPSSIPALIKTLEDPTTKVRGQACEALANMTGETFDFVDVAPESVRAESVAKWRAWWEMNKDAILSGTDPREVAGAAAAPVGLSTAEPELPPLDDDVPTREFAGAGAAASAAPPPGTTRAPDSGRRSSRKSGRNITLDDMRRKKQMREARQAARGQPRAKPVTPKPGPAPPVPATPEEPEAADASGGPTDLSDLPSPDDDELPPID